MTQSGQNCLYIFLCGFWGTGKIDNESTTPDARLSPGEHGPGREAQRSVPHGLRNAGNHALADGQGGFRGDVPGGKAGSAGGDQQLNFPCVGNLPQGGLNQRRSSGTTAVLTTA